MLYANTSAFRRLLEAKRTELSSTTSNRNEIVIEAAADEMDRLQQQMNRDIAIRNLDRSSTLLKNIQAALNRIQDGTYGVCSRCEEPIPERRLTAVPWASYCVSCQETIDSDRALRETESDRIEFAV